MSAEPLYVPDDFGDEDEAPAVSEPFGTLADPENPDSDYLPGEWAARRQGTVSRPLVAGRCEKIKRNGSRCRAWQVHGLRYCVTHSGYKNLPNVKEYHEQVVHNARMSLLRAVPKAIEVVEEILDDDETPAATRLRAATEIWDRVGIRGGTELDVTVEHMEDPGEALTARLEQLRARAAAAAEAEQKAIDARTIPGEVLAQQDDGQIDLFTAEEDDDDAAAGG